MDLLLVRHALAEPLVSDDASRALTPAGRERFVRGVRGLAHLGIALDLLLCSPLRRARQTAELLAELCDSPARACDELATPPGEALLARLEGRFAALVGHEPWMGQLAGSLTDSARWAFEPGGVAWLRGRPTPGGMAWVALLPPAVLDALAGR